LSQSPNNKTTLCKEIIRKIISGGRIRTKVQSLPGKIVYETGKQFKRPYLEKYPTKKKTLKILETDGCCGHACHLSTQEAEAGGSQVQCQPELHRETVSQKKKIKTKDKDSRDLKLIYEIRIGAYYS
jgi:hypothetical protein